MRHITTSIFNLGYRKKLDSSKSTHIQLFSLFGFLILNSCSMHAVNMTNCRMNLWSQILNASYSLHFFTCSQIIR